MTDDAAKNAFGTATGQAAQEDARRRAARMHKEKQFFDGKAAEYRGEIHSHQTHERLDLDKRHDQQRSRLDAKLEDAYGENKRLNQDQLAQLKAKAEKSHLTEQERAKAKALQANLKDIQQREKDAIGGLRKQQGKDLQALADKHKEQDKRANRTISAARQERQAQGWKPAPVVFREVADQNADISFQKPAQGAEGSQGRETHPKSLSDAPRPSLTPKGKSAAKQQGQKSGQSLGGKSRGKGFGL